MHMIQPDASLSPVCDSLPKTPDPDYPTDASMSVIPLLIKLVYQPILIVCSAASTSSISVCGNGQSTVSSSTRHESGTRRCGDDKNVLWVKCKQMTGQIIIKRQRVGTKCLQCRYPNAIFHTQYYAEMITCSRW